MTRDDDMALEKHQLEGDIFGKKLWKARASKDWWLCDDKPKWRQVGRPSGAWHGIAYFRESLGVKKDN